MSRAPRRLLRLVDQRGRQGEDGFALIAAIIVMMIVLGLGLAMLAQADGQQQTATYQQADEGAFAMAEAALNAQIFELSVQWPSSSSGSWPTSCTAANAGASFCPAPATVAGSFAAGYPNAGSTGCSAQTPADAWGSALSNGWTTYVRDDGAGTSNLFSSSADQTQPSYDANGDNALWVRAVGVVNCRSVTVIQKVTTQFVALTFPQLVINANGFSTSNNGNKVIVDIKGNQPQPSQVGVRCNGFANKNTGVGQPCTNYGKAAQVSPTPTFTSAPASTLTPSQIASLRSQAIAKGTYFNGTGQYPCPASMSQLTGAPAFVENCGNLSFAGNGSANSAAAAGYLVLYNGTIDFGGTVNFYGVIYAVNAQGSSGDVITTSGNAQITGALTVDGNGTIGFGSSGENLVYDASGFQQMQVSAGAAGTPNSFRVLPQGQ